MTDSEAGKPLNDAITYDTFKEWTKTCGVRQVQDKYEEMANQAKANKRSVPLEMKSQGYRDFHSFSKACPQFDTKCWPIELGELGSGCVLYFHFLAFLAAAMSLMFLVQIPAIVAYAADNNLCQWGSVTDWQQLYKLAGDGGNYTCDWSDAFIKPHYLTPGNIGPDQEDAKTWVTTIYTICLLVLAGGAFLAYQHSILTERKVDAATVSPSDFAILVKGMPTTATDEQAICDFFRQFAVRGKDDTEIVKVVIGWDASEFRERIKEIRQIRAELSETDPGEARHGELTARLKALNEALSSVGKTNEGEVSRLKSSGTVVVIFRWASDMRACVERWNTVSAKWLYRETEDASFLPAGNGIWPGEALPKYPIGLDNYVMKLSIDRSAEPGDINWEELGVDWQTRMQRQAKTNGMMFGLVLVCFGITYGLNKLQDYVKEQQDTSEGSTSTLLSIFSFLPAIGIIVTNVVLCLTAKRQAVEEYHDTFTDQEFSQALKMTVAMIVNTAGVTYFCNAKPQDWYVSGGLVNDIASVIIFSCWMGPLLAYFDLGYKIKGLLQRRKLTPEKLEYFNNNLRQGPPKSKEAAAERNKVLAEIEFFKGAYAPNAMNNPRRYANALKNFVVCLVFMPLMPWLSAVGAIGLMLQYKIDKYLLLRWQRRPERPANSNMSRFALRSIKYVAPLCITVAFYVFLCPCFANKTGLWSNFLTCLFLSFIVSFLMPYSVWSKIFFPCFTPAASGGARDESEDYYHAQYMWSKEMKYHKDQFIYKKLPESVNPEYLKPGEKHTLEAKAAADSYGAAAQQAGADASAQHGPSTALRGGQVIEGSKEEEGGVGGDADVTPDVEAGLTPGYGAPTPSLIGLPTASASAGPSPATAMGLASTASPTPEPPTVSAETVIGAVAPSPIPAASSASAGTLVTAAEETATDEEHPPSGSAAGLRSGTGVSTTSTPAWEFKVKSGWEAFDHAAQGEIQRKYEEWKAGGTARTAVQAGGYEVSIYFDKMSSKTARGHPRAIRNTKMKE